MPKITSSTANKHCYDIMILPFFYIHSQHFPIPPFSSTPKNPVCRHQ